MKPYSDQSVAKSGVEKEPDHVGRLQVCFELFIS
jgi:hypothetical protein